MSHLLHIAILRTPDGFKQLYTSRAKVDAPFRLFDIPLEKLTNKEIPLRPKLLAAWQILKSVKAIDEKVAADFIAILLLTIGSKRYRVEDLPAITFGQVDEKQRPKATAKHPRAFQGTKYKPPKSKSAIEAINLLPYLFNDEKQHQLLRFFEPLWDGTKKRLVEQWGFREQWLSRLVTKGRLVSTVFNSYWFDQFHCDNKTKLADDFSIWLLPLLHEREWRLVLAYRELYGSLGLKEDAVTFAAIVYLVANLRKNGHSLQWPHILTLFPIEIRVTFIKKLLDTELSSIEPQIVNFDDFHKFDLLFPEPEDYLSWLCWFLKSLQMGADKDYLLTGIRIAHEMDRPSQPKVTSAREYVDYEQISELWYELNSSSDSRVRTDYFMMDLWQIGGILPAFSEYIHYIRKRSLTDWAKYRFLMAFYYLSDHPEKRLRAFWQAYNQIGREKVVEHAEKLTPSYQCKAADCIFDFYSDCRTEKNINKITERLVDTIERVCRRPFKKPDVAFKAFRVIAENSNAEQWNRFITFTDEVFSTLIRFCATENHRILIARGIRGFMHEGVNDFFDLLERNPRASTKMLINLGAVEYTHRRKCIAKALDNPLASSRLGTMSEVKLIELLKEQLKAVSNAASWHNLLSKKLRSHLGERTILTSASLKRHLTTFVDKQPLIILRLLEAEAIKEISSEYPELECVNQLEYHAIVFSSWITDNRRALHQLLRAYWRGDKGYVRRHPKTKEWLAKHPELNVKKWLRGEKLTEFHPKKGQITLSIERNPLEILKMGTYSRSCLGLGGSMSYTAAAAALDFNKHVVYARTQSGRIVGRQLIAYNEESQLVCFEVYGHDDDDIMSAMFAKFDYMFAKSLGIEVYTYCNKSCSLFMAGSTDCDECHFETSDHYIISTIISHCWYDDGCWDPRPPK